MLCKNSWLLLFVLVIVAFGSPPASALNFNPSDSEWATWGEMCRSRYVVSAAGRDSRFAPIVRQSDVEQWRSSVPEAWGSLHHYCAAKVVFSRAQAALTEQSKKHQLNRVLSEVAFSKGRTPKNVRTYADYLVLEAQAHAALGDFHAAFSSIGQAKELHPGYGSPYALEAIFRRKKGDLVAAEKTLQLAIENDVDGLSEVHYLMAIVHRDLGEFEVALMHAEEAEKLGYPLTRLKHSLARKVVANNGSD